MSKPSQKTKTGKGQKARPARTRPATRKAPARSKVPNRPSAVGAAKRRVTRRAKTSRRRDPRAASLWTRVRERVRFGIGRQADDVWGLILIVLAVVIALGFIDKAGPLGSWIVATLRFLTGVWAFGIPVVLSALGVALVVGRHRDDYGRVALGAFVTFAGSLALFHLMTGSVALAQSLELVMERGGALGSLISFPMRRLIGFWGAFVVISASTSLGILIMTRTSVREVATAAIELMSYVRTYISARRAVRRAPPIHHTAPTVQRRAHTGADRPRKGSPTKPKASKSRPEPAESPNVPRTVSGGNYTLPPLDLLAEGVREGQSRRMLEETARQLEQTLRQHNVDARLTKIVPGPTVTRYEIELAPGVKVSRVTSLSSDIAYALATPDVRLLAPIPGKSAIGVEVPNRKRQLVTLGDVLRSPQAQAATHPLTVALGEDISGTSSLLNLAELPHLLIAGATGAGKSSCINSIVTSLLVRTRPEDVRLIMIDPKRVELGQYNGVAHLLTRVITNPKKASDALQWAVAEMDRRYDLLADAAVRDIVGYREKHDSGQLPETGFDRFPYLVVIIDELNDLMMVAGRDVETAIVRIAQMARAVGIHLVIATQRPSVNVITGVIKANVPSRLAFSVASQTDSRVIIDTIGADKLVGMGDMLVVTARDPRPQRVQGAWVEESEVLSVVQWVKEQQSAEYQKIAETVAARRQAAADEDEGDDADLIRQATELVVRSQLGSTSMLQRKLRVGFARAGRLMDILENKGVVGPSEGSKAREVLITVDELATEQPAGV